MVNYFCSFPAAPFDPKFNMNPCLSNFGGPLEPYKVLGGYKGGLFVYLYYSSMISTTYIDRFKIFYHSLIFTT